ncbi:MAG: EAL domain-containing protein [Pseudomonadota bacterium]
MFHLTNKNSSPSLRTRYIILTVLLGLLVILTVLFFYTEVASSQQQVTDEVININKKRNKLETIHSNLVKIYQNIDLFLDSPLHTNYSEISHQLISNSIENSIDLVDILDQQQSELKKTAELLQNKYQQLKLNISILFETRVNISKQYPGMAISANEMPTSQNSVTNNLQILIDEIENKELQLISDELYPTLLKSYTLWINQISQMRIYLANRLASFSNKILPVQAASLHELNQKFLLNISKLEKLYLEEDSFEAEILIKAIKTDTAIWINLFLKVRKVSESDNWRGDTYLMKNSIIPLTDEISALIFSMDKFFLAQERNTIKKLKKSTATLSTLLFMTVALFLLFISAIIWSLDWMVFKPISSVVLALKSKAFGKELPQLVSVNAQEINYLIEAFSEMDEQVNNRQKALEYQALHDHLTGLPNRFMLNQRLEYQILYAERDKQTFSLFLIDLNHFKDVNDSLGHLNGDILLEKVAKRLTEKVRKVDTVARLGGDEFAIMLPDTNREQSEHLANKIHESITSSFTIDGNTINIGLSIGIVCYPQDGQDKIRLLQLADLAMYVSKRNRTRFSHYDAKEDFYGRNRLSLISDLRNAIDNNTLELYFQPQIDIDKEQIIGAEALLRWNHAEHGFIQPDKIVELAEYEGIIHQLSLWVLKHAIAQCSQWHKKGMQLSIAVNLSVQDLSNPSLNQQIAQLLKTYQFPSQFLTLEITESGMMENPARSIEMLKKLNHMGIHLSIDDFGTGFSSLAYLKQLPVHELKIDRSFILDMDKNESDTVIVQSTINLGHNLGLRVIAEGVERQQTLEILKKFACDQAQGYLFSKPKNEHDFLVWVQDKKLLETSLK